MNEKFQINNFNIQSLHINQFASLTQTLLLKCLYQARKMSDHVCGFQGYQFSFYHFILYFTFLFSLCVYASATGQYNVIWSFGPYNIFLMTYRSIHFHMTFSAMNYLLYFACWNCFGSVVCGNFYICTSAISVYLHIYFLHIITEEK